ncbi:unnamed protein product, partial [Closterium sp. Naga37s-1]
NARHALRVPCCFPLRVAHIATPCCWAPHQATPCLCRLASLPAHRGCLPTHLCHHRHSKRRHVIRCRHAAMTHPHPRRPHAPPRVAAAAPRPPPLSPLQVWSMACGSWRTPPRAQRNSVWIGFSRLTNDQQHHSSSKTTAPTLPRQAS